jgi:uncharacterized protein (DUF1684 family)
LKANNQVDPPEKMRYIDEIMQWRSQMNERIRAENSWLALSGLFWLDEREQSLEQTSDGGVLVSTDFTPQSLGSLTRHDDQVHFKPNPGWDLSINGKPAQETLFATDVDPEPDFIEFRHLRFVVIKRGERVGIRIWDNNRLQRKTFPERSWYPINTDYKLKAQAVIVQPGRVIKVPNVLGDTSEEEIIAELVFKLWGETYRLLALEAGEGEGLIVFGDQTNGKSTYPAGRFLVAEIGDSTETTVDFNKAYNPPCAFTSYATCPLPPEENQLPIKIPAGERSNHGNASQQ